VYAVMVRWATTSPGVGWAASPALIVAPMAEHSSSVLNFFLKLLAGAGHVTTVDVAKRK
jgi:hypothetical protein